MPLPRRNINAATIVQPYLDRNNWELVSPHYTLDVLGSMLSNNYVYVVIQRGRAVRISDALIYFFRRNGESDCRSQHKLCRYIQLRADQGIRTTEMSPRAIQSSTTRTRYFLKSTEIEHPMTRHPRRHIPSARKCLPVWR